jgi:hypothetical protein
MSHPTSSQRATSPTVEAVTRRRRSAPHQQPGGASDLSLKRPHRPIPDHHSSRSTPDDSGDVAMPPEATAALPKQGGRQDMSSATPPRHHEGQRTGGTPPRPAPDLHNPAAVGGKAPPQPSLLTVRVVPVTRSNGGVAGACWCAC